MENFPRYERKSSKFSNGGFRQTQRTRDIEKILWTSDQKQSFAETGVGMGQLFRIVNDLAWNDPQRIDPWQLTEIRRRRLKATVRNALVLILFIYFTLPTWMASTTTDDRVRNYSVNRSTITPLPRTTLLTTIRLTIYAK